MKKAFMTLALAVAGWSAHAQNGAIMFDNQNSRCDVSVTMYAVDNSNTCTGTGSVVSFSLLVPALTQVPFTDPCAFSTAPGPGFVGYNPCPLPAPAGFQWADITFTYNCPTGCTPTSPSGTMSDPLGGCLGSGT